MHRYLAPFLLVALSIGVAFVPALAVPNSNVAAAANFNQEQRVNSIVL